MSQIVRKESSRQKIILAQAENIILQLVSFLAPLKFLYQTRKSKFNKIATC